MWAAPGTPAAPRSRTAPRWRAPRSPCLRAPRPGVRPPPPGASARDGRCAADPPAGGTAAASRRSTAGCPFLVGANLPYYVSTPLLFRLLEDRRRIDRLGLMLPGEVVARLAPARGGQGDGGVSL